MSEFTCPKCNSENTQKLSAIVASGTSHSQSVGTGGYRGRISTMDIGTVAQHVSGTTSSRTNTAIESALARKLAAPQKKSTIRFIILYLIMLPFVGVVVAVLSGSDFIGILSVYIGILSVIAVGLFVLFLVIKNWTYNTKVLPGLLADWNRSFYCHRCENVFKI